MELEEYTQYHETKLHESIGFAYNTYLCTIPEDFDRVGLHWHEQMEIIYIKKGSGTVSVNLTPYHVEAGSIIPVMPGELHSIDGDPNVRMEYENIIFSLSILDSTAENDWCRTNILDPLKTGTIHFPRPITPGSAFYTEAANALDGADHICENRVSGYSLLVKSQLFLFLHALYQYRYRNMVEKKTESVHADKLKQIITWVKEHYQEQISIQEGAKLLGYSEAHFMRIFKQETGQTFVHFLNEYRLAAASYYIKETNDSISKIAESCGFENLSYFIRIFKKKYGVSPREFRKRQ